VLVQPYFSLQAGAAGELAWLEIVEPPAAVADPDFPGTRPLLGHAGAHRDAQLGARPVTQCSAQFNDDTYSQRASA